MGIFIRQLFTTVLHPRFVLFLPTFILHLPGYATALLAHRLLAKTDEEETHAQFKAVFGGLGATAVYVGVTRLVVRRLVANTPGVLANLKAPAFLVPAASSVWAAGRWLFAGGSDLSGRARAALGVFGIFYATSFILSHWHNYWVACESSRALCAVMT